MPDFDSLLSDYGDNSDLIDNEIRTDLLREITTTLGEVPFDRASGLGIDLFENETINIANLTIFRLNIVSAIARYNGRVIDSKKVVVSQNDINIEKGQDGIMYVNIYYIQYKDLDNPIDGIGELSVPIGG